MLKNIFYIATFLVMVTSGAGATCTVNNTTYSCFAGYYLNGTDCVRCPKVGFGINAPYGTSPDRNTGGIESCYAKKNIEYTDFSGTFIFTDDCQYTK